MAGWDLFRELDNLRREIDEAFRGAGFGSPFGSPLLAPAVSRRYPPVNISEDESNIYVAALVPGVDPAALDISVLRNTVTISGERKPLDLKEGSVLHRAELAGGTFSRTLELPADIDPDKVSATSRNGILMITLGKAEHAKPKKIDIALS
jgi:HSP20 family protein